MPRISILFLSFLLSVFLCRGQAKLIEKVTRKGSELVLPYEKYQLPNGLTVIVHEDHSDPVVHVDVTYHVGSGREELGKSGFAHFFEHMLFQGSDHVGDDEHFRIVTNAGGTMNGSTNRDRTNYYQTVPANQLEKVLWLEADRMGFFLDAVTQRKFEVQRSTVKNERGERYDNVPYGQRFEYIARTLYPYGHPYSWLTIGYVEDLNRVDVNDLKNFFLRWYGPNNAVLSVGGDVNTAELLKLVEKYFGSIQPGPRVDPLHLPVPSLESNRYISYVDNYARLPMLNIVYPTVPEFHPDKMALACLAQVLGQGRNALLFQLLTKKQLALQVSASSFLDELSGEFSFVLIPPTGKSLAELEKLFRASLDSFEARGVTDDDVRKFAGSYEAQLINGLQSVSGKISQLAYFEYLKGNPNYLPELLRRCNALTKEDVMRVYHKYIKNKGAVVLSILPRGQESLIAAADNFVRDTTGYMAPDYGYAGLSYVKGKDNFDRSKMPESGALPSVEVPRIWKADLNHGASIIGTKNDEIPTVTLTISLRGGHLMQAADLSKAGLASFFASMMNEDTENYTAEDIAVELQKLGASINVASGTDAITFTVQSLKKNLKSVMALLEERMLRPRFTEASFNRIKNIKLQSFKAQKANAETVAELVAARLNYGPQHILGISEQGTEETVNNISLQDIETYYRTTISMHGAKLVVVGDIDKAELLEQLGFLKKLPSYPIHLPKLPAPAAVSKTKVYLVDIPQSAQSAIRVGYATGLRYDATGDYYKAGLANFPLGGNFNSRLNMNLREDKAWTYGAGSYFNSDEHGGIFESYTGVRSNATDSALVEIMKEIKTYAVNGPTEEDLAFIRNAVTLSDARRYETGPQKALFIGRILDYNLPEDYVKKQMQLLQKITKSELKQITQRYINPEKMNILLVGDRAMIEEKIRKLGYEVVLLDSDGKPIGTKAF